MKKSPTEPATYSPLCIGRARGRGMRRERGRERRRGKERGRRRERGNGHCRGSERGIGGIKQSESLTAVIWQDKHPVNVLSTLS